MHFSSQSSQMSLNKDVMPEVNGVSVLVINIEWVIPENIHTLPRAAS